MILLIAAIGTTVSMTGSILYHTWQMKKSIRNYLKKRRSA